MRAPDVRAGALKLQLEGEEKRLAARTEGRRRQGLREGRTQGNWRSKEQQTREKGEVSEEPAWGELKFAKEPHDVPNYPQQNRADKNSRQSI